MTNLKCAELIPVAPKRMMADSPIAFPDKGCLPPIFSPDLPQAEEPADAGSLIFRSPCRSVEQIAAIQKEMPAGTFTPPPGDWTHLRSTRRILTVGGTLRLLALGDSIVNDIMRSGWVNGLGAAYPKAHVEATVYVRNGGGCQHYCQDNRVEHYIVPRRPDLVFIGGISHKTMAGIREVIHRLRRASPQVDILLATGAFGTADPRDAAALATAEHGVSTRYGQELRKLAAEEHCAYLDMTTPWVQYILSSSLHPYRFYRDRVHANEYGEQILARIMLAFFTAPDHSDTHASTGNR